jgi:hypothetical protein
MTHIYFEEHLDINVYAAQIGISSLNWDYTDSEESTEKIKQFMVENSYDILPIRESGANYNQYYHLDGGELIRKTIAKDDQVYYLTRLYDLIRLMNDQSRSYYFLSDHSEIVGLVSNVNLNSKNVYTYFYNKLSHVEIELGRFASKYLSDNQIENYLKLLDSDNSGKVLKRFNEDVGKGLENGLVEYLYLSQFESIISKFRLFSLLKYTSRKEFEKELKPVNGIRNWIAHPINSPKNGLALKLYKAHVGLDKMLLRLSEYRKSEKLIDVYINGTTYFFEDEGFEKVAIKAQQKNPVLDTCLSKKGSAKWCFITGWNPMSKVLSAEKNKELNEGMKHDINGLKKRSFQVVGMSDDEQWKEDSFLVLDISKKEAVDLGNKYKQKAILYGEVGQIAELVFIK